MAGNMIWGEKQAEAIRRISEQAYELAKGIEDHNQYEEFKKLMEGAGFVFSFKGNDPSVNVCVTICTDVWNRLMKASRVAKVNKTTKAMDKIDEENRFRAVAGTLIPPPVIDLARFDKRRKVR